MKRKVAKQNFLLEFYKILFLEIYCSNLQVIVHVFIIGVLTNIYLENF